MAHGKSLKNLGGGTGQSGDLSLKSASGNASTEISLNKDFNVTNMSTGYAGFAPIPGVARVRTWTETGYDNLYYGGNNGQITLDTILHTSGRPVNVYLYDHTKQLVQYKVAFNGQSVTFADLDGEYASSYNKFHTIILSDAWSGAQQRAQVNVSRDESWPNSSGYQSGPGRQNSTFTGSPHYLPPISSSEMESKGARVPYGGAVTLALDFSGHAKRFYNIKSTDGNYTWSRSTSDGNNFSASDNTVTVTNTYGAPNQYMKLRVYVKFEDSNFNADATNYNKQLSLTLRLLGPGAPGFNIISTPESVQQTTLPYANTDNGTVVVRVVRAWHAGTSTTHYIYLYKGSSLINTKTITNTEADYSFTGLNSGNYTVYVRDASSGAQSGTGVAVGYGGGNIAYDRAPHLVN